MHPSEPSSFPRRILVATVGLAPQIVTETLYALCVLRDPPFVPTEIYVITTAEGRERTRLTLIDPPQAHLVGLAREYDLPALADALTPERICVVRDAAGHPLPDISAEGDNAATADLIVQTVRELTSDESAALHVSIAGGRKTMGFLLGTGLTLLGRAQDRMSHVLVEPQPLEQHPEFFYPPKVPRLLHDRHQPDKPVSTAAARVVLADIPFVRLRQGLPQQLVDGAWSYSETVVRAQGAVAAPDLVLDADELAASCGGVVVDFPPVELAFYLMLARRRLAGGSGFVHWSQLDPGEFLAAYRDLPGVTPQQIAEQQEDLAGTGGSKDPRQRKFEENKSRINARLKRALGPGRGPYLIQTRPYRGAYKAIGLTLPPDAIRFGPVQRGAAAEEQEDTDLE